MATARIVIGVAAGLLALGQVAKAERVGPSFDCQKAHAPLAQVLCSDPELSRLDLRFAQAYWALLKQVGEAGKRDLQREDVGFIDAVQKQCGLPGSGSVPSPTPALRDCVRNAYEKQRLVWLSRLTPPASEEANRPIETHLALQHSLLDIGLLPPTTNIDGVYGVATRTAIAEWQRRHDREITGILSDADAHVLENQSTREPTVQTAGSASQPNAAPPKVEEPAIRKVANTSAQSTNDIHLKTDFDLIHIGTDPKTHSQFWAAAYKTHDICFALRNMMNSRANLITVVTINDIEILHDHQQTKRLMQEAGRVHINKCPGPKQNYWPIWVIPFSEVQSLDPINGRVATYAKAEADYSTVNLDTYNNPAFNMPSAAMASACQDIKTSRFAQGQIRFSAGQVHELNRLAALVRYVRFSHDELATKKIVDFYIGPVPNEFVRHDRQECIEPQVRKIIAEPNPNDLFILNLSGSGFSQYDFQRKGYVGNSTNSLRSILFVPFNPSEQGSLANSSDIGVILANATEFTAPFFPMERTDAERTSEKLYAGHIVGTVLIYKLTGGSHCTTISVEFCLNGKALAIQYLSMVDKYYGQVVAQYAPGLSEEPQLRQLLDVIPAYFSNQKHRLSY